MMGGLWKDFDIPSGPSAQFFLSVETCQRTEIAFITGTYKVLNLTS